MGVTVGVGKRPASSPGRGPARAWLTSRQTFHFVSGLPRAGSTLTAAILRQNPRRPRRHVEPGRARSSRASSPRSRPAASSRRWSTRRSARASCAGSSRATTPTGPSAVIFDTNRGWTAQLPALTRLFPDAKLICCVRDVAWVMDSLERQFRGQAFENTRLFASGAERASVYTRLEALAGPNRLVGHAWQALREACYGEEAERLLILDYDILTTRPARGLRARPRVPRPAALRLRLRERRLRRPGLRRRARPRGPAPGAAEGGAAAAPDRPAARPLQALLRHGLLARPEGFEGVPHREAGGGEMQDETCQGLYPQ